MRDLWKIALVLIASVAIMAIVFYSSWVDYRAKIGVARLADNITALQTKPTYAPVDTKDPLVAHVTLKDKEKTFIQCVCP